MATEHPEHTAQEDAPAFPAARLPVPHTQVHIRLRRVLENAQDVLVIVLMVLLLIITMQTLWKIAQTILGKEGPLVGVVSQIVYVLILMELYRTLIVYLREHRVSVVLMVEVTIVSLLRELILISAQQIDFFRAAGISLLFAVLGGLLALERWRVTWAREDTETSAH